MRTPRGKARRTMICENIFAHCDQSDGPNSCWPFLRSKNRDGYGHVWVEGRLESAHRFAFMVSTGPIPAGLSVLHSCDNPSCCNPAHLRIGSQYDNVQDREDRNRGNQASGENNGASKLSTRDVIFIRRCRDIYNTAEMAAMLNVEPGTVAKVLNGSIWSHVTDLPIKHDARVLDSLGH